MGGATLYYFFFPPSLLHAEWDDTITPFRLVLYSV